MSNLEVLCNCLSSPHRSETYVEGTKITSDELVHLPPVDGADTHVEVAPLAERDVELGAAGRQLHEIERALHLVPCSRHL